MTAVFPAASVRRRVPLRAVCRTERSGSTASDIGSPVSATPLGEGDLLEIGRVDGCGPGRGRR